MYLSHYKFTEKPFQITTDPKFVWLGEKHQEALSILKYGIMENKGFLLLTGEVGTGKTVLINCLTTLLDIENIVATVPNPDLNILDFFNFLADGFNFNKKYESKGDFLLDLKNFLHASSRKNQKVLLIVDEAHRLGHELFEEIRLLSNIELHNRKLINIFFVGQNEINQKLLENRNRALAQRIAVRYNIDPLTETETGAYIRHRLGIAGCKKEIFKSSAIHEIYSFAEGIPRLVNIICDHSLLTGYALGKKSLDARIIRECADELKIPVQKIKNDETIRDEKDLINILEEIRLEISRGLNQTPRKKVAETPSKHLLREKKTQSARPAETEKNRKVSEGKKGAGPEGKKPPAPKTPASRTILLKIFYFVFSVFLVSTGFQYFKDYSFKDKSQWGMEDLRPQKYKESLRKEEQTLKAELSGDKPEQVSSATGAAGDGPSAQPIAAPEEKPAPAERFGSPYRDVLKEMMTRQQRETQPHQPEVHGDDAVEGPAAAVEPPEQKADLASIQDLMAPEGDKIVISFGNDSNEIPQGAFGALDRLARVIMDNPEFRLTISGYTDRYGGIKYNKRISEFRANTVKSYLVGKGADPSKITTRGLGPENPVASNDTLEGRQANRRVELEIDTGNTEIF